MQMHCATSALQCSILHSQVPQQCQLLTIIWGNRKQYLHQFRSNIFQGHHKLVRTLLQHVKTDVNTRDNQGKRYDDEFDDYHHNHKWYVLYMVGRMMLWQ